MSEHNLADPISAQEMLVRKRRCDEMRKTLRGMNSSSFTVEEIHTVLIDTGSSPEHEKKLVAIFKREVGK